jgi:subtilisin family serine protease
MAPDQSMARTLARMLPSPAPAGPPSPWPPRPVPPSPWPIVWAVVVGLWAVAVTLVTQSAVWLIAQALLAAGLDEPAWIWPVASVGNAVLVAVPSAVLATVPRSRAVRTTGRVWLLGGVALGLLGALRAVPQPQNELYLAAFALVAALAAVAIARIAGRSPGRGTSGRLALPATSLAIAAGGALLLPWLWLGALGGLVETVLAVVAAVSVAALVGAVLDGGVWPAVGGSSGRRLVLVGGLVAGVTLLLVAAGTGQSGSQLAAMLGLPPAGFVAATLQPMSRRRYADYLPSSETSTATAPTRLVVGIAALGPLAFVDPEEISVLLATMRDVPNWSAIAAGASAALALLLAVGYWVAFARARAPVPYRWIGVAAAAVVLVSGVVVYVVPGQPGLYGERLFVVLREQADLSDVPAGTGAAGRAARAHEVYRRLVTTAQRSQADLRRELDRLGLDYRPYYLANAIEVDAGPIVRAWLARRSDVDRVLLSQQLRPLPAAAPSATGSAPPPGGPGWNLTLIGADLAVSQAGADGAGIVVGSSDSGVDGSHPALAGRFRGGDDSWYDPWNGSTTPVDHAGHGTHTLGTAVGSGGIGVAPGAHWVGCVNLDRNLGSPAHYLDCLQFMLAPFPRDGDPFTDGRPERGPQVLTNSWGCPAIEGCDLGVLRPATAALAAAGVFLAVAAGNTGPFCGSVEDPPAPYPDVLTVGAVDRQRTVTSFSSRGPAPGGGRKPDVVAPGDGVLSAMPGGGYAALDGTSMATPHVAGVVALMWSANPGLIGDLDRTRRILADTATAATASPSIGRSAGCTEPANVAGAGLVNAYAAVAAARAAR